MGNSKPDRVITRSKLIEQRLLEMTLKGEAYPSVGTAVEYKQGSLSGTGKVIGYDIVKGELRAVCVPIDGQTRIKGTGIIPVRLSNLKVTSKNVSQVERG